MASYLIPEDAKWEQSNEANEAGSGTGEHGGRVKKRNCCQGSKQGLCTKEQETNRT